MAVDAPSLPGTARYLDVDGIRTRYSSFRVIAADRLGQGFTDVPTTQAGYTAEAVLRHMHGFRRALGLGPMHVAGQSRGGHVHPDESDALVTSFVASAQDD